MSDISEETQTDSEKNRGYLEIALIFFIVLFCILLAGQIIIHFYDKGNFEKVFGTINTIEYKVTSYSEGGTWKKGQPNYSVVMSLNNGRTYEADLHDGNWLNEYELKRGDQVTIYHPSKFYNLLSLNFLDFGCNRISELDFSNQVFYKLNYNQGNIFIIYLITAIIGFGWLLYKVNS
jgi:hypothetical protein